MKITHKATSAITVEYDKSAQKKDITYLDSLDDFVDALAEISHCSEEPDHEIDRVLYNPPATVVFWKNGGKTVVRDDNMKGVKKSSWDEDEDVLVYTVPVPEQGLDKTVRTSFKKWKQYGLMCALAKKYVPNLWQTLNEWA